MSFVFYQNTQTKADITGFVQETTKLFRTVILDKNILSKT